MSEKLASAEIAESRRYLESIRVKTYACRCASCIANLEEAVERDTRERCAQQLDELCEIYIAKRDNTAAHYFALAAERIRGVNQ